MDAQPPRIRSSTAAASAAIEFAWFDRRHLEFRFGRGGRLIWSLALRPGDREGCENSGDAKQVFSHVKPLSVTDDRDPKIVEPVVTAHHPW